MENRDKIILDLCGGTGAWSKPYKDAGYDVRLITLPEYDVRTYEPPKNVYGILAAPPCTDFSRAKSTKLRDFQGGMEIVKACLEIIWRTQIEQKGKLTFWVVENPMGLLRRFLGRPETKIQPWWYGDFHSKDTDLWGWFNEPVRVVHDRPIFVERAYHNKNSKYYSNPKKPKEYAHMKLSRGDIRSITPPGFAKAFFKANQ